MIVKERRFHDVVTDADRLIDWLGSEAALQREGLRNQCLLAVILASGLAALVGFLGRGPAAIPPLVVALGFLVMFVASLRRRVEDGARTLVESLRERPHEVRRISHLVYGRHLFRTNAVEIESDGDGYLFVKTHDWDVVLNGLAARCRNARVELCGPKPRRRR